MDSNYETWLAPLRVLLLRKMVLVQITKDVSYRHRRCACGSSDAERSRVAGWRFRLLHRAHNPLFRQGRTLAYLSDGNGKLVMPTGIKKARMTSRANEAGRKD